MTPKRIRPGSRESAAYELISRETSLDLPNGSSTLQSPISVEDGTSVTRRPRFSYSRSENPPPGEEIVGLLTRSHFDFPKNFHLSGGLRVASELITQSTPSLLFAVVGSVITGIVFDEVQYWPAFVRIGELFILVPILLNLKGCLEMNLASRLSTSVLLFKLDLSDI